MRSMLGWVISSVLAVGITAVFLSTTAKSEQPTPVVGQGTFSTVELNCMDVKVKLSKVHEKDSLMRVNAGQNYKVISGKLMKPLHAKIVEDSLDGSELVKKAASFEEQLEDFRLHYQEYEVALTGLLKMDCEDQKQLFYTTLREVRDKRNAVYEDTQKLEQSVTEYKQVFGQFKETFEPKKEQDA